MLTKLPLHMLFSLLFQNIFSCSTTVIKNTVFIKMHKLTGQQNSHNIKNYNICNSIHQLKHTLLHSDTSSYRDLTYIEQKDNIQHIILQDH